MSLNLFRRMDRYDRRIRQLERSEGEEGGGDGGTHFHAINDLTDVFTSPPPLPGGYVLTWNEAGSIWVEGPPTPGPAGPEGPAGADSTVPGPAGPPGEGVPAGGTAGQVLTKDTGTDYDTSWQTGAAHADTDHDDRFVQLPGAWQSAAGLYFTGWGAHPTDQAPRFRLEGDVIRLDGSATRSSGSLTTIFTLPSGYRPNNIRRFWVAGGGATQNRVAINTTGVVDQTSSADFTRTSLEGITFPIT